MGRAALVGLLLTLCTRASGTDAEESTPDKTNTQEGVSVKVMGQSGKMELTIPTEDGSSMTVACEMDALRQLDADGKTLGAGGSAKRSFNFPTQDFTINDPTTTTYEGLNVSEVAFEALNLAGGSKLRVVSMIFLEGGNFTVGNDTVSVAKGTVKFNVELSEWSWCEGNGDCTAADGVGDSVELDISVSADGEDPAANDLGTFNIGGGQKLLMLDTYSTDGGSTWVPMPDGYPKVEGSKFTLKFPRWTGKLIYDPAVGSLEVTRNGDGQLFVSGSAGGSPPVVFSSGIALLAAMLAWTAA